MVEAKSLGASLYVPSTHKDIIEIANGDKLGQLKSVIFCTEDAVLDQELGYALFNLSLALKNMKAENSTLRFVRVRNPSVMARVMAMRGAEKLTGFVLPKISQHNFDAYFRQAQHTSHMLMPTLETIETFDEGEMKSLRQILEAPHIRARILALRIGGNDLLALLGIRRPRNVTLYRTPLGSVIARLVTLFRPYGFSLTAPVFDYLDNPALLDEEVSEDLAHGLIGKTAIHPDQIPLIERHYRVDARDLAMAQRIVESENSAVFQMNGAMCEIATHRDWAHNLLLRAEIFGNSGPAHRDQ